MMPGTGMFAMMLWMPIGILLFIALVVVVIWLLVRWSNNQKSSTMLHTPQRQVPYEQPDQPYQQGYQPRQQMPETYQEDEMQHQYPQPKQEYDQPQISYPEEQEMPGQY
ncbi:MAG: hypothetical protein NVSMB27_00720 [Ktedonobacteraceae bacterium]